MKKTVIAIGLLGGMFLFGAGTDAAGTAISATSQQVSVLNLGDPAPAIKVGAWFKGTPTEQFLPGKVYVLEFWATWCGPCKKMIPHLTELAKAHSDNVTFIGVSVWEHPDEDTNGSIASLVTPFVKSMGDTMNYNVAADGTNQFMATNWMKAAGIDSIPTAFIIGKDERVAWIGSPVDLGPVLNEVIDGKWDVALEQKRVAANRLANARRNELEAEIMVARKAGDYKAALAAADKARTEIPSLSENPDLLSVRLEAMLHCDSAAAFAYIKELTDKDGLVSKKPGFVWSILRIFPKVSSSAPFTAEQWKSIAQECEPMVKMEKTNASEFYSEYAVILRHADKIHEAVKYQQEAVDLASKWNDTHKETLRSGDTKALTANKEFLAELIVLDK